MSFSTKRFTRKIVSPITRATLLALIIGAAFIAGGTLFASPTPDVSTAAAVVYRTDGCLFRDPHEIPGAVEMKELPPGIDPSTITSTDLSAQMPPVGNQGSQGSCVAWAVGYYHMTHNQLFDHNFHPVWDVTRTWFQASPAFIYNQINGGNDIGSYFDDALNLVKMQGVARMSVCPYNAADYTTWPSEGAFAGALSWRGDNWQFITLSAVNGLTFVKGQLDGGHTVVTGIKVYDDFCGFNGSANMYRLNQPHGSYQGGHAVTIVGYDDSKVTNDPTPGSCGAFKLVNSWGTGWGASGYFWMSYAAMSDPNLLLSQGSGYYITDKWHYNPRMTARVQITHNARDRVGIQFKSCNNNTIVFRQFYMLTQEQYIIDRPFPNHKIVFDLTDVRPDYMPTPTGKTLTLTCTDKKSDGKTGTIDYFSGYISQIGFFKISDGVSPNPPVNIPDYNVPANAIVTFSAPHWLMVDYAQRAPIPMKYGMGRAPSFKMVKDGGCLTSIEDDTATCIYALKGNNTTEFYCYNTAETTWTAMTRIPEQGASGKIKAVKKGACLTSAGGRVYAAKGNRTSEFWCFQPGSDTIKMVPPGWSQLPNVPGAKPIKEGAGTAGTTDSGANAIYFLKGSGTQEFYRFDPMLNVWQQLSDAPLGSSGRTFKDGSGITYDPDDGLVFGLKGTTNEFFAYDPASNTWDSLPTLPFADVSERRRKVKSGAGIAYLAGRVYAIKGNNTREVWTYDVAAETWMPCTDLPLGAGRNVKGGGALTAAGGALYILKGNNTREFYKGSPDSAAMMFTRGRRATPPAATLSAGRVPVADRLSALRIAPNPFSSATTISYSLSKAGNVSLKLYDMTGKLVTTLATGYHTAGTSSFIVHRSSLSSGIYILKLESDNTTASQKLILQ